MIRDGRGDERCIRTPRRRPFDRFLYPVCSGCQLGKGRKIEAPRTVKRTCDFVVLCPFLSELLERSEEVVLFPRFFLFLACEHEIGSVRRARLSPAPWFERGIECWRRELLQPKRAGDRPTRRTLLLLDRFRVRLGSLALLLQLLGRFGLYAARERRGVSVPVTTLLSGSDEKRKEKRVKCLPLPSHRLRPSWTCSCPSLRATCRSALLQQE